MGLIRFTVKATVVGGIAYYTYYEGLWSKSEETAKVYGRIYNNVAPYVNHDLVKEIVQALPEKPRVPSISMTKLWNDGVMTSIQFVSNLPLYMAKGICGTYRFVRKQVTELNKQVEN